MRRLEGVGRIVGALAVAGTVATAGVPAVEAASPSPSPVATEQPTPVNKADDIGLLLAATLFVAGLAYKAWDTVKLNEQVKLVSNGGGNN